MIQTRGDEEVYALEVLQKVRIAHELRELTTPAPS